MVLRKFAERMHRTMPRLDQWATEATDAKAWRKATFDPEIVAQRRARIMERGRTQ